MKPLLFSKSFSFRTLVFQGERHNDASLGIKYHYVGRMRAGRGLVRTLTGEEMALRPGDVFYLPMGLAYHSYWWPDKEGGLPVSWESYGFEHLPTDLPVRYPMQRLFPTGEARALLDRLAAHRNVSPTSVGLLYLFLGEVLPTMEESLLDANDILLAKASAYVAAHPNFRVGALAKSLGMSESALFSFFRAHAGTTPVGLKQQILAERATQLLCDTDRPIEEIATTLGFCSAAHLRKTLKTVTGKTPSEIRKSAKTL